MGKQVFQGLKISYEEFFVLLKNKEYNLAFNYLIPDINHWVKMLFTECKKNTSYKVALSFSNSEIELFDNLKYKISESDAWQEIAIIYWKRITRFKIYEYYTGLVPAIKLKSVINAKIARLIKYLSNKKPIILSKQEDLEDIETELVNNLDLMFSNPYTRYIILVGLIDAEKIGLSKLTHTKTTYKNIRRLINGQY